MTWKPIEKAPRDGRFFIGANAKEVIVCNWPKQRNIDYAPGNWRKGRGKWNGFFVATKLPLTHWMELPKLPEVTMADLSPAAQAVLNATDYPEDWATRVRVAAALRAAAKQVRNWDAKEQLLTIATELEGAQ